MQSLKLSSGHFKCFEETKSWINFNLSPNIKRKNNLEHGSEIRYGIIHRAYAL